jgi:hypothetical protein
MDKLTEFPLVIGEAWAEILHVVYAALVPVHGYDSSAKTNPASTAGNAVWLHLFIDGLALQPCNPTCELVQLAIKPRTEC